jgi:glycosyltransferase involved in cell wall biosynthesis
MNIISIIIPCYFNELNLPVTHERLLEVEKLLPVGAKFHFVFIDDGSKDNTYDTLLKIKETDPAKTTVVKLSGNFGSYNAILAGMKFAIGECSVVIAADLQDPPELIIKMYEYWLKGIKLVLANRNTRDDKLFERLFSNYYHKLIKRFAINSMPKGGFDFCLFDKQLREEVVSLDEKNTNTLFLLVWMKYDFVNIPYHRVKREIGKSRWTLRKKIKLLIDSFVSFSYFPIRLISTVGILLSIVTLLYGLVLIYLKLTGRIHVQGWASILIVFLFVSSFQMIAIGILGEYLWRNLDASRNRPAYFIDKIHI